MYFNRWKVQLIPSAQLTRCDVATYKKLGGPGVHAGTVDTPGKGQTVDHLRLVDDVRIPFPHDDNMLMVQELIEVFEARRHGLGAIACC